MLARTIRVGGVAQPKVPVRRMTESPAANDVTVPYPVSIRCVYGSVSSGARGSRYQSSEASSVHVPAAEVRVSTFVSEAIPPWTQRRRRVRSGPSKMRASGPWAWKSQPTSPSIIAAASARISSMRAYLPEPGGVSKVARKSARLA